MKMTADDASPISCSPCDISKANLLAREGFAHCYSVNSRGDTDSVFIFGGLIKPEKTDNNEEYQETNDLLMFKPGTKEVVSLKCGEEAPSPRSGSSLVTAGDRLFMFGGFNHSDAWLNDFWTYQLPSGPWKKSEFAAARPSIGSTDRLPTGPIGTPLPTPRDKATLNVVTTASGTHLWLFGGFGPMPAGSIVETEEDPEETEDANGNAESLKLTWFDDLYCINAIPNPDGLFEVKKPMQLNLDSPTSRAAHGTAAFTSNTGSPHLAVFGGRDTEGRTNDLSIFDTKSRKWTAFDVDGNDEEDVDDEDDEVVDDEEVEAEEVVDEDEGGMDDGIEDGSMEDNGVQGDAKGDNDSSAIDDIAEQVKRNLEAIKKKTMEAEADSKKRAAQQVSWPECRSYSSVCVSGNRWLFVFGGRNEGDAELNDLWMFDLENTSNGWYELTSDKGQWPQPRSSAMLLPIETSDNDCKLLIVGGSANLLPDSMHCANVFDNAFVLTICVSAALEMERKPVVIEADKTALLKAANQSVVSAIKGDDTEADGNERPLKRAPSPSVAESPAGDEQSKRVRVGGDE